MKELRAGREKIFHFPTKCPVCGGLVRRVEGEAAHRCINKNCPGVKRRTIYHFVSKGAMDIEEIGPKTIDQLIDAGLIKDVADFYLLKKEDLLNLERFAEKSAQNAVNAVQARKKISLDRFIFALGIPHIGSETAIDLARHFGMLKKLSEATLEELQKIRDVGGIVAKSIYEWFRNDYNQKLLRKFEKVGVHALRQETSEKSAKLKGLTFVFTGSLDALTREKAEEMVRENGGEVSSSVSKETDYVVAGIEPGSKYDKARKLGIRIITEASFLKLLA